MPSGRGSTQILVDGVDRTALFVSDGSEPWSVGKTLNYTSPTMPRHVVIILNQTGGGGTVLAAQDLLPSVSVPQAQNQGNWYFNPVPGRCSNWAYRKKITIYHTRVTAAQTSFPVLISLSSDPDLSSHAMANGNDILFTDSGGTNKLSHEIENYTSSTGTLAAWVNVPALSSTMDTVLYLYYGNATSTSQQDATGGTWSNGYQGVWHLEEAGSGVAGEFRDSTQLGNNGQGGNGTGGDITARITGKMDYAQKFDGVNDKLTVPAAGPVNNLFASGGTYSAWIYPTTVGTGSEGRIADKSSGTTGQNGWSLATYSGPPNNALMFRKGFSGTRGYWTTPAGSITLNAWNYVAVSYNSGSTANNPSIYINGVSQAVTEQQAPAGSSSSDAANILVFGNRIGSAWAYNGTMDEVRASNALRSPDWIATEYANQNSPSGFYSVGSEEKYWLC